MYVYIPRQAVTVWNVPKAVRSGYRQRRSEHYYMPWSSCLRRALTTYNTQIRLRWKNKKYAPNKTNTRGH